ncbi:MAG: PilN domain-containing protein [Gemmatimonadetes bacterium]|jgi:Tfp pilus assembly protein PilN|nr:PilN domain-containing protein [Gemmatimonadota bacterium]
MIEINLLPGARKKSKSTGGGSSFDVRAFVGSLGERFKDPWLGIAAGGVLVGVAAVGAMWFFQGRTAAALDEQLRVAVQDSARFDAVVKATRTAQAQRDSIMRQMAIIQAIDGERFVWPHIMDEVSRALPTYTWLRSVGQSSAPSTVSPEQVAAGQSPKLTLRVIGLTVDLQALTIFMKQLEASDFLENVTIAGTQATQSEGKTVTEFTLDMAYSKPPASAVRTVPLTISVR